MMTETMIATACCAMMQNPYPGKFIAFEGIDGSGKTTQAKLLAEALAGKGHPVFSTCEPTKDGIFGKLVRALYSSHDALRQAPQILWQFFASDDYKLMVQESAGVLRDNFLHFESIGREIEKGKYADLSMFIQLGMILDRHDHRVREEVPALGAGTHVISDRDFLSTLAYGAADGLDWRDLLELHEEILGEQFIVPDLVIVLDVPPEVGLVRTQEKQGKALDRWDDVKRLTKIREAYQEIVSDRDIFEMTRIAVFSGEAPREALASLIRESVESFLMKGRV